MKISLIVDTHFIALLLLLHWQTNKTKNDLFVIAHTAHSTQHPRHPDRTQTTCDISGDNEI